MQFFWFVSVFSWIVGATMGIMHGWYGYELGWDFFLLYCIMILPLGEVLFSHILKKIDLPSLSFYGVNSLKYVFLVMMVSASYFLFQLSFFQLFCLAMLFMMLFFRLDVVFAFFFSVFLFLFVPAVLIIPGQQDLAQDLANGAYYLLLLGIGFSLKDSIISNQKHSGSHSTS